MIAADIWNSDRWDGLCHRLRHSKDATIYTEQIGLVRDHMLANTTHDRPGQ